MLQAKDYAVVEKAIGVEKWVSVSYYIDIPEKEDGAVCILSHGSQWTKRVFLYDMPRHQYERYMWVLRWRLAKLICLYPRNNVQQYICFYDKKTGLELGFGKPLSKLIGAKSLLTKYRNRLKNYIDSQSSNLFFNGSDEIVEKFNTKISATEEKIDQLEKQIKDMVESQKPNDTDPF